MDGFAIISLSQMMQELGEDKTNLILSDFRCPLAPDVEYFLLHKAVQFTKCSISSTFLVFTSFRRSNALIGYYTLANKVLMVQASSISKTLFHRLTKFGEYDATSKSIIIPSPLLGQLGKNFNHGYNSLINGDELIKIALDSVKRALSLLGGKTVYVECEHKRVLTNFYERNGFVKFWDRPLDPDETGLKGRSLYQMLKYFEKI